MTLGSLNYLSGWFRDNDNNVKSTALFNICFNKTIQQKLYQVTRLIDKLLLPQMYNILLRLYLVLQLLGGLQALCGHESVHLAHLRGQWGEGGLRHCPTGEPWWQLLEVLLHLCPVGGEGRMSGRNPHSTITAH